MAHDYLADAMAHIIAHPEQHDQKVWICSTRACLAGHIVTLAGAEPAAAGMWSIGGLNVIYQGRRVSTRRLAAELAGLTRAEAQHLFAPERTLAELCHDTARLRVDQALECGLPGSMPRMNHAWARIDGPWEVAAHRRTAIVRDGDIYTITDHPTRGGAYDYASDIATCRGLGYEPNPAPKETVWQPT